MRSQIEALALVVLAAVAAHAQTSAGSNRVISPTVVAYSQQHDSGDGTNSLDLLVLWRGTPGWFMRGDASAGGDSGRGGFGHWTMTHTMSYGDIRLTIRLQSTSKEFEPATTVLSILDREVPLRNTNVVLIDGADSGTPTIVGTQHVDPTFAGPDAIAAIIKRSRDLFQFLQCDAALSDPVQGAIRARCEQMRP